MATPFNAEEFRKQMSGQAPQAQQMAVPQAYPSPQPAMMQAGQQQYVPQHPQTAYQPMAAPAMAQPQQTPPPWAGQQQAAPQAYQPHPGQPPQYQPQAAPMRSPSMAPGMPPAHMFAPPPSQIAEIEEDTLKKPSRFKLQRARKEKPAKEPKMKAHKEPKLKASKIASGEVSQKTKSSTPMIFMFGMATGILCVLVGNAVISSLILDKTSQSFSEIERSQALAQQHALPSQETPTQTAEVTRVE